MSFVPSHVFWSFLIPFMRLEFLPQADLEAVKAVVKRKRGVTRKNATEESQDPSELFGGWGAPAALKDLAAVHAEAAEDEEAERAAM